MKKKQKKHSEFYKKSYKKSKKAQKEDLEDFNSLLENESYKIGTFRRNERGFGFVNIGDDENEIFIAPKFTLNAADCDEVLIKILDNIKLANKKHALAFISNKISRIFFIVLAKKVSIQKLRRNTF